jgi:hypothetical protein
VIPHPSEGTLETPGNIVLFGFEPAEAVVRLRFRPKSWRLGGAVRFVAGSLVVAPAVGLVPPHAPWIVGALAGGVILARRRWNERFTLEHVEGFCPRCRGPIRVRPGRLRTPHPVPCEGCHHEASLELPADILEAQPTGSP